MQRVLIVDDSKTAQIKLKKMLLRYDVSVDLAFSAEEALGYLSHRIPAVIFLDHHMEGMDGLKALKLIKENPSTSTVPVIMYTSEKGEVYVSQARALGALDILSKDFMRSSSLEKLMGNLKIEPSDAQARAKKAPVKPELAPEQPPTEAADSPEALTHADTERVLEQISSQMTRLMEFHFNDVRQQLVKHNAILRTNVNDQITSVSREVRAISKSDANEEPVQAEPKKAGWIAPALIAGLGGVIVYLGSELVTLKQNINKMAQEQRALSEVVVTNVRAAIEDNQAELARFNVETQGNAAYDPALIYQVLNRGMQLDFQFDLGSDPLGPAQISKVRMLVDDLMQLGFSGAIDIDIRFGNACWQKSDASGWQLADADTPASACTFSDKITQEYKIEDYLSLEFANFEQTLAPVQNGKIAFTVGTSGVDAPVYSYPAVSESLTAGTWNKIAAKNNRLLVTLFN